MARRPYRPDDAFTNKGGGLTDLARKYLDTVAPTVVGANGQVLTFVDGLVTSVPVASILPQQVLDTETAPATNNTSTYAGTGLSISITLTAATSKVRIRATINGLLKTTGDTGIGIRLRRAGATVAQWATNAGKTGTATDNRPGSISGEVEETPGSVGPHTYTVEFASIANIAGVTVQEGNAMSTLVAEEVFV